jgi:hypothetical protein
VCLDVINESQNSAGSAAVLEWIKEQAEEAFTLLLL